MKIPSHTISGFLGSGKTTLLNHLLKHLPGGTKPAIIVNDFGDVSIDGELVEKSGYAVKDLPSGCLCCTLRGSLIQSLEALVAEQKPGAILMETTGVANPADVVTALKSDTLKDIIQVGNVVTVLDAGTFYKYVSLPVVADQVKQANTILLNKMDKAPAEAIEKARAHLAYLSQPDATVIETRQCAVDVKTILNTRPVYIPDQKFEILNEHHHSVEFESFAVEGPETYSSASLQTALKGFGEAIVRAKGVVKTGEGNKLLQLSPSGIEIHSFHADLPKSRLVVIGRGLPKDAILRAVGRAQIS